MKKLIAYIAVLLFGVLLMISSGIALHVFDQPLTAILLGVYGIGLFFYGPIVVSVEIPD